MLYLIFFEKYAKVIQKFENVEISQVFDQLLIKHIEYSMLIWLTVYLTLEMFYLFVLCTLEDKDWKHTYEQFCKYCLRFSKNLPVELILGFYVTSVVGRWWDQFSLLPFSDELAMKVVNFLPNTVSDFFFLLTIKYHTHCNSTLS